MCRSFQRKAGIQTCQGAPQGLGAAFTDTSETTYASPHMRCKTTCEAGANEIEDMILWPP